MGAAMANYPFLFLDLETTGHDPLRRVGDTLVPWHEIIDMGWVLADSRDLRFIADGQVKMHPAHPERCLPRLVNNYQTRAARGQWNEALPLSSGIRTLLEFVGRQVGPGRVTILRGQNFFFDWQFLSVACAWVGVSMAELEAYFHYSRLDNRSMAVQELFAPDTQYCPDDYSMRTSRLLEALGIEPEPAVHTAINGARKAHEVATALNELKRARLRKA